MIDCQRSHSRLPKKALHLTEKDDLNSVLAVNAATIAGQPDIGRQTA